MALYRSFLETLIELQFASVSTEVVRRPDDLIQIEYLGHLTSEPEIVAQKVIGAARLLKRGKDAALFE